MKSPPPWKKKRKKYTSGPRYWNVPVLVNTGTFLVYQYCPKMWYLSSLEHTSVIQKLTILEHKNSLVLSYTHVPVSGTWSILFPKKQTTNKQTKQSKTNYNFFTVCTFSPFISLSMLRDDSREMTLFVILRWQSEQNILAKWSPVISNPHFANENVNKSS